MHCPVCGKEWSNGSVFCSACGQPLSQESAQVNDYWNTINAASEKQAQHDKEVNQKAKMDAAKKKRAHLFKLCIVLIIAVATVVFVNSNNANNKMKLAAAHENMIGRTFVVASGGISGYWNGDDYDRTIVKILDESNLNYTRGNYTLHIDGSKTSWTKNKIYEDKTYLYQLTISFLGKISIEIDDVQYKVGVDDDNTVNGIYYS